MIGKKDRTLPTPAQMPSTTSEWTTGFVPKALSPASMPAVAQATKVSMSPCSHAPITPNVSQNTSPMMSTNAGTAV